MAGAAIQHAQPEPNNMPPPPRPEGNLSLELPRVSNCDHPINPRKGTPAFRQSFSIVGSKVKRTGGLWGIAASLSRRRAADGGRASVLTGPGNPLPVARKGD